MDGLNMLLKIALLMKLGKFPLKCPTAENGLEYFPRNCMYYSGQFSSRLIWNSSNSYKELIVNIYDEAWQSPNYV